MDLVPPLCKLEMTYHKLCVRRAGAGERRGVGEVTFLQNTNATQSNGRAQTPVMQPIRSSCSTWTLVGILPSLNYYSERRPTAVTLQMKRFANNGQEPSEDLAAAHCSLRLLRDASAAISMATGYCSIRSKSNSWRLRFCLLWLHPGLKDRQSDM